MKETILEREWDNGEWIVEEHELIEGGEKLGDRVELIVKGLICHCQGEYWVLV